MSENDWPRHVCIMVSPEFKVGDLPPDGYIARQEWAAIQYRGGLRQRKCSCGKWRFPQEQCCDEAAIRAAAGKPIIA